MKKKQTDTQGIGRDKLYVGQFAPSKQALGAAGQPRCPPSPEAFITEQDKKFAKAGALDSGTKLGTGVVSCDFAMQSLTNMTDHHLAVYQKANPKAIDRVLENCQKDLAAVPMIPAYESPELAGIAQAAFEEGFQAGIDEAFRRILLIEVGLTVLEVVFFEATPLIEVALARSIRRSLDAVKEMPLFLPVAMNGLGVSVKVGRIIKGSSRLLAKNMKIAKRPPRLAGEFTHHIAAHGDHRAIRSVEILERFGIKVDDEVNGVFLPGYATSPNPFGKVVHGNLHTKAYHDAVFNMLNNAKSRADAEQVLRKIAWNLEHGIMP